MGRLFGTDGVRGLYEKELTLQLAYALGRAGAQVLAENRRHKPVIVLGRDTRFSGPMLEEALVKGICSTGAKALLLGVVPTPAVAYLTRFYRADAGIVISASHNPAKDNGIKFFNHEGYKLPDAVEDSIEARIEEEGLLARPMLEPEQIRVEDIHEQAVTDYVDFAASIPAASFKGLKVFLDCANGAASETAEKTFRKLGAEVSAIFAKPDGYNINDGCGSTHMEALQRKMREGAYDVGFAFDGDADRCLAVDARGNLVDGDQIMALCATRMKQKGLLKRDTIVVTVMSNLGLHLFAEKAGMHLEVTKVGDRYVLERMLEQGYNIGGEQSGHVIFLDDNTTGDGLLSSLHVCQTMLELNQPLEELAGLMQVLPQVLLNVQATKEQKERYEQDPAVSAEIAFVEKQLKGAGRVLIRPSGTEPLIRVMLEGEHPEEIEAYAHRIAKAIENVK